MTPTFVLGRLALATSPTGSESLSYDGLGRINASVFTDSHSSAYIEKHKLHTDGTPESLDLLLPDTSYATERVSYAQDSAGRSKTITYANGGVSTTLYDAPVIDPFGRVREAKYGQTDYAASYADVGRRLLSQVKVSSPSGSRDFTYQGFDPVGRERSRVEVKNGASTGATTTWSYDALARLSSALTTSGPTTTLNQQFTYDPLGNLQTLAPLFKTSTISPMGRPPRTAPSPAPANTATSSGTEATSWSPSASRSSGLVSTIRPSAVL